MGTPILQPSFARGELSPSLYARVDTAMYSVALRTAKNFIVRPTGGVVNRPGTQYIAAAQDHSKRVRLIPFAYSTETTYVIAATAERFRFLSNGALVIQAGKTITGASQANPVVITAIGHGYSNGDHVQISGIAGMTELNGNLYKVSAAGSDTFALQTEAGTNVDGSGFTSYTSGGISSRIAEVATPWSDDEVFDLSFTQSADVMTFAHQGYAPRQLTRTSATEFAMSVFETVDGPFRDLNPDEAVRVAASARVGNITVDSNADIFTADHVGSLFYIENRNYSTIKPWVPGERTPDLALGVLRRSDGKTYKCTSIPSAPNWTETGGVRPTHDRGKAWDGPGDQRTSSGQTYAVGVEWEFRDYGFGVVEITGFTNAKEVTAVVTKNLPDGVVGGVGSPGNTWNETGDGSTMTFSIPGASSSSASDYTVTIGDTPTSSGQTTGGGGGCVSVDSLLMGGFIAGDVKVGDVLPLFDPVAMQAGEGAVTHSETKLANIFKIVTARGASLVCSETAPIPVIDGGYLTPARLVGKAIPACIDGVVAWDAVVNVSRLGLGRVQHITVGDRCFWAGEHDGKYILHHNLKNIED